MIKTITEPTPIQLTDALNKLGVVPISIIFNGYDYIAFYQAKKTKPVLKDKKGKK